MILDLPIEQIIEEYQNGMNTVELAEKYGCCAETISRRLKENSITIRSQGEAITLDLPIDQIIEEYQNGMSTCEIAEKYGCSGTTISNRLKQYSIEIRSICDAKKGKHIGKENPNWRGGYIIMICDNCNKKIEKTLSQMGNHNFCDQKCSSEWRIKYYKENPEASEKLSAAQQHIPYSEWPGFTDKSRPHLTPIHACIQLNQRFLGSEGHHIMTSVVIFVPKSLHRSISHTFKTNAGMDEINELAFNFLISAQW